MEGIAAGIERWIAAARERLSRGELGAADLEELRSLAAALAVPPRQRLLYLHAREPSVTARVIGWAEHPGEDPGGADPRPPYATVLEAIADGWRCIHFPQQQAPFDDRQLDLVGFEFILEKLEPGGGAGR